MICNFQRNKKMQRRKEEKGNVKKRGFNESTKFYHIRQKNFIKKQIASRKSDSSSASNGYSQSLLPTPEENKNVRTEAMKN